MMEKIVCPLCNEEFKRDNKKFVCENNHSFDMAKQGYLNLHIKRNSKNPGDDKDMVIARRDFLNSGFYEEISNCVNDALVKYKKDKMTVVDIGCGEGYYTKRAYDRLGSDGVEVDFYALDISKEAVLQGAKSYKGINWLVASASEMPFKEKTFDLGIVMFTKVFGSEYARVLNDDGILIIVTPNRNHLIDIKEVVYDKVKFESYNPMTDLNGKFEHLEHLNVDYKKTLVGSENIMNLFNMTPYRWRSPREGVKRLEGLESLDIRVDINVDIYKLKKEG